jgi:hypothetical protein
LSPYCYLIQPTSLFSAFTQTRYKLSRNIITGEQSKMVIVEAIIIDISLLLQSSSKQHLFRHRFITTVTFLLAIMAFVIFITIFTTAP